MLQPLMLPIALCSPHHTWQKTFDSKYDFRHTEKKRKEKNRRIELTKKCRRKKIKHTHTHTPWTAKVVEKLQWGNKGKRQHEYMCIVLELFTGKKRDVLLKTNQNFFPSNQNVWRVFILGALLELYKPIYTHSRFTFHHPNGVGWWPHETLFTVLFWMLSCVLCGVLILSLYHCLSCVCTSIFHCVRFSFLFTR